MPKHYTNSDFRKIDPLFKTMSVKAINELEWVDMSTFTLNKRRKELGIPQWKPKRKTDRIMSTKEMTRLIRNMGGVMNHG